MESGEDYLTTRLLDRHLVQTGPLVTTSKQSRKDAAKGGFVLLSHVASPEYASREVAI